MDEHQCTAMKMLLQQLRPSAGMNLTYTMLNFKKLHKSTLILCNNLYGKRI